MAHSRTVILPDIWLNFPLLFFYNVVFIVLSDGGQTQILRQRVSGISLLQPYIFFLFYFATYTRNILICIFSQYQCFYSFLRDLLTPSGVFLSGWSFCLSALPFNLLLKLTSIIPGGLHHHQCWTQGHKYRCSQSLGSASVCLLHFNFKINVYGSFWGFQWAEVVDCSGLRFTATLQTLELFYKLFL